MNLWRDMKTAPVLESILATDGNHVYCGYIDNKAGQDVFVGYDLQEMEMEELFLYAIKGWMPTPDHQTEESYRKKTERIITELRGMLGKQMYYGEMVGAEAPYRHSGPLCYENPEDYSLEKAVNLLERMLAGDYEAETPEKTADDMFWEMGFYPTEDGYEHAEENESVKFEDDGVWFCDDGWDMKVGIEKILAAAQKIREIEVQDDA